MRIGVRLQKEALQFTDERGKLEGELLNGIDVVKCNSWEVRIYHNIAAACENAPASLGSPVRRPRHEVECQEMPFCRDHAQPPWNL